MTLPEGGLGGIDDDNKVSYVEVPLAGSSSPPPVFYSGVNMWVKFERPPNMSTVDANEEKEWTQYLYFAHSSTTLYQLFCFPNSFLLVDGRGYVETLGTW